MGSMFVLLELDECASHPCMNNGTCTDLENGFFCTCLPEWNGTLCTELKSRCSFITKKEILMRVEGIFMILDPCQSSPCGPLGKCIPTNQAQIPYYCRCPDGQNTMFKCPDPSMFVFFFF
jgi:hypothetical protein